MWPVKSSASRYLRSSPGPDSVEQCYKSCSNIANGRLGDHGSAPAPLPIDDLVLLHHSTTVTYSTLNSVESQQQIWQDVVVKIGFKYQFVLRSILALAALHQAATQQGENAELHIQASMHLNLALQDFHKELSDVNAANCNAIFAFSTMAVIHAFIAAVTQPLQDAPAALADCLRLVRGVASILKPHYPIMVNMELAPLIRSGFNKEVTGEAPEILRLRALVHADNDEATNEAYLKAIDECHTTYLQVLACGQQDSDLALLMRWAVVVSEKFFALLSARDPVALIILTYFATTFRHIQPCWWLEGWHDRVIAAIECEVGSEYCQWLQWPKQQQSLTLKKVHQTFPPITD